MLLGRQHPVAAHPAAAELQGRPALARTNRRIRHAVLGERQDDEEHDRVHQAASAFRIRSNSLAGPCLSASRRPACRGRCAGRARPGACGRGGGRTAAGPHRLARPRRGARPGRPARTGRRGVVLVRDGRSGQDAVVLGRGLCFVRDEEVNDSSSPSTVRCTSPRCQRAAWAALSS
jgi:hypothetical protein